MRPSLLPGAAALLAAGLAVVPLPADATAAAPTCGGRRVTLLGTGGDDVLRGTSGADVIDGRGGADVINGLAGDDVICGGYGADDLRGQGGNDRIYGGLDGYYFNGAETWWRFGDTLRGGPGNDTIVPGFDARNGTGMGPADTPDTITWDTSLRRVAVDLPAQRAVGDGSDRVVVNGPVALIGTKYDDFITGSAYRDVIDGRAGGDTVDGGGGDDLVQDSDLASSDDLSGGAGDDTVTDRGRCGDQTRVEVDNLDGGPGKDVLDNWYGPWCQSVVTGGDGADRAIIRQDFTGTMDLLLSQHGEGQVRKVTGDLPAGSAFQIEVFVPAGPTVTVTGSDLADHVVAGTPWQRGAEQGFTALSLLAGAGDDILRNAQSGAAATSYDGGEGQDCYDGTDGSATLTAVEATSADAGNHCPGWPDERGY